MEIDFRETPEKWVTVVQATTNKSIGNRHSCILSQELPNISKIPQLTKAAFTNILDVIREGKIRVEPHTQVPHRLGGVKGGCPGYQLGNLHLTFLSVSWSQKVWTQFYQD